MKTEDIILLKNQKTNLPINQIFRERFSPRVFSSATVLEEELSVIFEAVRFSPSSYNRQPWFFYLAKQGTRGFEKLSACLFDSNRWAISAPVLILACFIRKDQYGENHYASYDLGQAVMTLVAQAQALGYYSHQIGGFDKDKAKKLIENKDRVPWVMIAVGRIGDYEKADKKLVQKDAGRQERKDEIVDYLT